MAVAVLTSGGDSPGMNSCLRAIVRKALYENVEIYGVYEGFRGLYENRIELMCRKDVAEIINRGGTILNSARFPEFQEKEISMKAADNLKALDIDTLFVIGGNGSYLGGMLLSTYGINVINLPGTIDNDILGTDYTIGFDTAVNTAVEAIDKIRDTSSSHRRASVVEVMGRNNGDIAFYSGLASGAEQVITCETGFDRDEFIKSLTATENKHKTHSIIILSENYMDINELSKLIEDNVHMKVNKVILGHIQRGGTPSAYDRMISTRLGHRAFELYAEGITNVCVGLTNNEISYLDFDEYKSLNNKRDVENKLKMNLVINEVR